MNRHKLADNTSPAAIRSGPVVAFGVRAERLRPPLGFDELHEARVREDVLSAQQIVRDTGVRRSKRYAIYPANGATSTSR